MSELNREQIIKDLECCKFGKDEAKCKECNWHPWIKPRCWRLLASNALALIKELTEENESLTATVKERGETIEKLQFSVTDISEDNRKLTEENERLRDVCKPPIARNIDILKATTKADTVRKMQERLTTFFASDDTLNHIEVDAEYINSQIDKIAKELEDGI